ncbi:protoporphyrinogen oxidase [Paeniglutamicibacter antarcticus]|uniref:Coproporphyrinogen III oxidase n=1 Tax=Arthrobacter terrae TaxID=2935737 RepID=A0A931CTH3_9MICC|nr:protoporphyrinogen oxidase [Arthrobacter terrae]MBG0739508.1 protoporphyrinogen oxidase [Arthrobacter terrae]
MVPRGRPQPCAVVVGGGIAGLVAARDLVHAGYRVTVLEASGAFGGSVGSHTVAGLLLDSGAESFATRSTAVADLVTELGLGARISSPDPSGAWVQLPTGALPLPRTGVLGIPADPWAPEVRKALGFAGSLRAALDAKLPASVGTRAEVCSVADLVRARMGARVLERLVAPVVGGVHSADPDVLDVDMVAPGLRQGIVKYGSLAAAVAAQRGGAQQVAVQQSAARPGGAQPGGAQPGGAQPGAVRPGMTKAGTAVGGLTGGMFTLVAALAEELRTAGVEMHTGHPVTGLSRAAASSAGSDWMVTAGEWSARADLLVVATNGPAAVQLLAPVIPELADHAPAAGPDVRLVTLVVDLPGLDAKPRGTGILVAPQTAGITAKALTHASAKWAWLADMAGAGRHVLRLSYGRAGENAGRAGENAGRAGENAGRAGENAGRAGENAGRAGENAPQTTELPIADDDLLAAALSDASTLLEQEVTADVLVDWDVVRWPGSLPFAAVGHRKEVARFRDIARQEPGLLLLGGWLAGNGLTAVVADARAEVARALAADHMDRARHTDPIGHAEKSL